jgi:tetratricopeptide (TPR) repeat protein
MAPENPRIAELRRRVHGDPASIAFAQLAEEYRRAGNYDEAVRYCRLGLARHPGYLSARVTLGRALVEVGELAEAASEFEIVLHSAPDNLAAIRGIAEIEQRRGNMSAALEYYKRALTLARFDPDLEEAANRIAHKLSATSAATAPGPASASASARPSDSGELGGDLAGAASGREGGPGAAGLIDFDAILESLGKPDAAPPAVMEILLSTPPSATRVTPQPPASETALSAVDAFADLERELRAYDNTPRQAGPGADVLAVLDELDAWVKVLQHERTRFVA